MPARITPGCYCVTCCVRRLDSARASGDLSRIAVADDDLHAAEFLALTGEAEGHRA